MDTLLEAIERERAYLASQEDGSEEYCKSLKRVMDLEKQLSDLKVSEKEVEFKQAELKDTKKDRVTRNIIEGVKVVSGIALPIVGFVWFVATEKEMPFTGTLREYTKYFLPKRN